MGGDEEFTKGHPGNRSDAIHLALFPVDDDFSFFVRPGAGPAFRLSAGSSVWVHEGDREAGQRIGAAPGDDGGTVFVGKVCPAPAGAGGEVEKAKGVTSGAGDDPGSGGGGVGAKWEEPSGDRVCVPGAWEKVSGARATEAGAEGAPGGERDFPGDAGGWPSGGAFLG